MRLLTICLVAAIAAALMPGAVRADGAPELASAVTVDVAIRGNAAVADPGISGAWDYNPAGLAALAGMNPAGQQGEWRHAASTLISLNGDPNTFALNWGGVQTGKDFGLGAGYFKAGDTTVYGAGLGKSWPKQGIAWGVSWHHVNVDSRTDSVQARSALAGGSDNVFDVGMLGDASHLGIEAIRNVHYGAVVRDVTDEFARRLDLGVVFDVAGGVRVAMDLSDLTDQLDRRFRIGATTHVGSKQAWLVGAGFDQGRPTAGVMYDNATAWQGGAWRFGAAWQDGQAGESSRILVGAFANWGL